MAVVADEVLSFLRHFCLFRRREELVLLVIPSLSSQQAHQKSGLADFTPCRSHYLYGSRHIRGEDKEEILASLGVPLGNLG